MAWKSPKIVEVSVGMEINMYMRDPQVSGRVGINISRRWTFGRDAFPNEGMCLALKSTAWRL